MRHAKQYGIVDRALLHGRYFHRLSHEAMGLYLFLAVVADREGKSFYGERTMREILRLSDAWFEEALRELSDLKLVAVRRPYFWLLNIEEFPHDRKRARGPDQPHSLSQGPKRAELSPDRDRDWHSAQEGVKAVLRNMEGR